MPQEANPVAPMVLHCCALLRERLTGSAPASGVLVGCGKGDEVAYLRRALSSARIVGLDLDASFSPLARAERCVVRADAKALPFGSAVFDFAAAFHSLEHVGDARVALDEILRVLRPGGWLYVGVPNRSRLVAYIGSFDATPFQKVAWNIEDWWARARGRFRNETGAHAGFKQGEFADILASRFSKTQFLTEDYLRFKYTGRLPGLVLDILLGPRLVKYSAAAHYALCQKAGPSASKVP
jgi:SAM-dependent methyltransferase